MPQKAYVRLCGVLIRKSAVALILLAAFAVAAASLGAKFPRAFFLMKIRVICMSTCNFRPPRLFSEPTT